MCNVGVLLEIASYLLAFNRQLGWSVSAKRIKKLASKVKFSLPGQTSGMTGSCKGVPALPMENILTVQTEIRLWSLDYFFLKSHSVEHSFHALMESGELNDVFQVWIKERKIASSTFMLKKNKVKIIPPGCLICNILSVWYLSVALVEFTATSQLRDPRRLEHTLRYLILTFL